MRDIAERFNARFGETLVVPVHRIPEVGARIMDLQEPTSRMSTTLSTEQGAVYILDDAETVSKKVRSAVTDSGSEIVRAADKPGISNLIEILSVVRGTEPEAVEHEFEASGYGDFKSAVAEAVVDYLAPTRERYAEIRGDEAVLERVFSTGSEKARAIASETLADVRRVMGVGPPGVPTPRAK
jgi:tryptophanyl-tRNA synthetase